MATKLVREFVQFNALIESEVKPVRVYGTVGLVPDIVNGVQVHKPAGMVVLEPGYGDTVADEFFYGNTTAAEVDSDSLSATLTGMYGVKPATMSIQVQKEGNFIGFTVSPAKPKNNEVIPPDMMFDPFTVDTQTDDFSATWESFRFFGVD